MSSLREPAQESSADFLRGGGEMGLLTRRRDWGATPLGPPESWPQTLKTSVRLMLASRHPMFIWWGPELLQFYNDAYVLTMGPERHPSALGQAGRECWAEIWDVIGPQIEFVMAGQGSTWHEDQLVPVTRHGRREDVWWTYGYSPIDDDRQSSGVGGVLVVCNDVTIRTHAQNALRESETRWRHVFERMHEGFALCEVVYDAAGAPTGWRYINVNPAWEKVTGIAAVDAIGALVTDIMPGIEPSWIEAFARVVETGEAFHAEGRVGPLNATMNVLAYRTDPGRFAALIRNVTEDRLAEQALGESEKRLRTLMEGIPQLVWRAGEGGVRTWSSPQWSAYTGLSEDQSRGLGWLRAVHPDDRGAALTRWREAAERGTLAIDYRLGNVIDGSYRAFQERATPVRDEAGELTEWLGTSTDVEHLRQLQDRQQVLVSELQHRTRNLLAIVQAIAAQTISRGGSLDAYQKRLSALGRAQGLLSHSSLDRVNLGDLVRGELAVHHNSQSCQISIEGPDVELGAGQVQTFALAVHELATNALKYGALGQSKARLSVVWSVEEGPDLRPGLMLEWRESGVVMPASTPSLAGYGRELIEQALPFTLQATTELSFGVDGVVCRILMPLGATG